MSRISFTLRNTPSDGSAATGSTLRSTSTAVADGALKADGYQFLPASSAESFFEVIPIGYGVNEISWGVSLTARDSAGDPVLSETPAITNVVLCYSLYGPPETVASGIVLTDDFQVDTYTHYSTDVFPLIEGQWAYYSLFAHYQATSSADESYLKLASLEVLIPRNYGSTLQLWDRIPEHYRNSDIGLGTVIDPNSSFVRYLLGVTPPNPIVGPLFKYLSIIGFDIDRTRTLIDYLMVARDPYLAEEDTLDALAQQLGVDLRSSDLGAARLRSALDEIGFIRRSKGTRSSLLSLGRAIAGADLELNEVANTIKFYSQRVNYVRDPLDVTGALSVRAAHFVEGLYLSPSNQEGDYDPTTYNPADTNTFPVPSTVTSYVAGQYWVASASASDFNGATVAIGDYIVAYGDGVMDASQVAFAVRSNSYSVNPYSPSTSYTAPVSGTVYTSNTSGASVGVTHMLLHFDDPVPVKRGDLVSFSIHAPAALTANSSSPSSYVSDSVKLVRVIAEDGTVLGRTFTKVKCGDAWGYQVSIGSNATNDWSIGFVEVVVDMSLTSTFDVSNILIERNRIGAYFDGNEKFGGWVREGLTNIGDYAWDGIAYDSVSLYTEQYRRTAGVLNALFRDNFPVGQTYTVSSYRAVPGQAAIDAYYASLP